MQNQFFLKLRLETGATVWLSGRIDHGTRLEFRIQLYSPDVSPRVSSLSLVPWFFPSHNNESCDYSITWLQTEGSVGCQAIIPPNIRAGDRNLKKLASSGGQGDSGKASNRCQFNLIGSFQPGIFLVVWYSHPYGIMQLISHSGHKHRDHFRSHKTAAGKQK